MSVEHRSKRRRIGHRVMSTGMGVWVARLRVLVRVGLVVLISVSVSVPVVGPASIGKPGVWVVGVVWVDWLFMSDSFEG